MRAIFVDCTPELGKLLEASKIASPENVTIYHGSPSGDELPGLCQGFDVVFTEHTVLSPGVFDACPSVRAVVFMGTGAGTYVDLADAERRGVQVLTTPGYGDRAVAEHALALMFAAARNIARMDRDIRAGLWRPLGGVQLRGAKLAVIGLGGIGTTLADMAAALGMEVSGWNRSPRDHASFEPELEVALKGADFVSLHLSLTDETRGLLDAKRLVLPRRGFVLVNTARAGLVDETALFGALETGQVGHVALDVFPEEPLPQANRYAGLEHATLTAHAAYMTEAAYTQLWARTLRAFTALQAGDDKIR